MARILRDRIATRLVWLAAAGLFVTAVSRADAQASLRRVHSEQFAGRPPARRLSEATEGFDTNAAGSEGAAEEGAMCKWLDELPRDLSSEDKNIERFGEKQDSADGSIDLHGMGFLVPAPGAGGKRVVSTSIKVVVASIMKVKCAPAEAGVACQVRVAPEDREDADGEARLQHVDGADSGTVLLPMVRPRPGGSRQRHVIRLTFTVPPEKGSSSCLAFEFMFQMRPVSSVSDELRCPLPLPAASLPPRKFSIGTEGVHFASDELLVTPDKMHEHSSLAGSFVYAMSLRVKHVPATLSAQVSFDWILGDMQLEVVRSTSDDLAGSSGHVLYKSNETDAEDEDAQFERTSKLWAVLPPGRYKLRLRDTTMTRMQSTIASTSKASAEDEGDEDGAQQRPGFCVRFAFNLDVEPSEGAGSVAGLSESGKGSGLQTGEGAGRGGGGGGSRGSIARGALVAVEPAAAHHLDPAQPLRLVLSFSSAVARFGMEGDGTADAGRGGARGSDAVHCAGGGGGPSWAGSALCSSVFSLWPASLDMQRGPLVGAGQGQAGSVARPATVYLDDSSPLAAKITVTWSAESLAHGVEYVLHVEQGYLKTVEGVDVSVRAHNGGLHSYRAAACDCHGHGKCDVERRCACVAGYAGDSCQRCAEGRRLTDQGICEAVKATEVCTRSSCNGHGAVSSRSPGPEKERPVHRPTLCPPPYHLPCMIG
jgi:hypothetical protein